MMKELSEKTWLITGMSSGIGLELATQLLEAGNKVVGIIRNMNLVEGLLHRYPDKLVVYETDILNYHHLEITVRSILSKYDVDIFVSNAGIAIKSSIDQTSTDELIRIINTNLVGAMVFIKSCVPYIKANGGKMIQIGSLSSQVALPNWSIYCASKFGISGFCETLSEELIGYDASVMIVEPGNVNTNLWNKTGDESLYNRSFTTDISVEKLCKRIISISNCEKMPLYLPMGSAAARQMIGTLNKRLIMHKELQFCAADVDENKKQKKLLLPKELKGRDIFIRPLGEECRRALRSFDWTGIEPYLKGFVDEDDHMVGKFFCGKEIINSSTCRNNQNNPYYIIFSRKYFDEISMELSDAGYRENIDYCYWRELISNE